MTIRPYKHEDFEQVAAILVEMDILHINNRSEVRPETADRNFRKAHMESLLTDMTNRLMLVAEQQGEITGFIRAGVRELANDMLFKDCKYGYISDLAVASRQHRTGVGSMLMNAAEKWLKGQGVQNVELKVYAFNEGARKFYASMDFSEKIITLEKII